jgi:hypothetical protein
MLFPLEIRLGCKYQIQILVVEMLLRSTPRVVVIGDWRIGIIFCESGFKRLDESRRKRHFTTVAIIPTVGMGMAFGQAVRPLVRGGIRRRRRKIPRTVAYAVEFQENRPHLGDLDRIRDQVV